MGRLFNPRGRLPSIIERQTIANQAVRAHTPQLAGEHVLHPNVTADGVTFQPITSDSLDATPNGQNRNNKLGRNLITSFPWFGYNPH